MIKPLLPLTCKTYFFQAIIFFILITAACNRPAQKMVDAGNDDPPQLTRPFIAATFVQTFVIRDGKLWAWYKQDCSDIDNDPIGYPAQVGSDSNWTFVASSGNHSLAIKSDGTLWAWGDNSHGQLGIGTTDDQPCPVQVGKDTNWVKVACGNWHSLGLRSDGTIWEWGLMETKTINQEIAFERENIPKQTGRNKNWIDVVAKDDHYFGIRSDNSLWAWGSNNGGCLGNGNEKDQKSPVQIGKNFAWKKIEPGSLHSVGIQTNGTLWTWGDNGFGQLGDSSYTEQFLPKQIGLDTNWTDVSAGSSCTMALKSDGSLWIWGRNMDGELGINNTNRDCPYPVNIGKGHKWIMICAGQAHCIAVSSDNYIWRWGWNIHGQLCTGNKKNVLEPQKMEE